MLTSDKPRNIDEAELAGWEGLRIDCSACNVVYLVGWATIRRRSGYRRLPEIKERLVCRTCGHKPRDVTLYRIEAHGRDGSPSTVTGSI